MMIRFREKNPITIAVIGLIVLTVATVGSFTLSKLPLVAGTTYRAEFSESGGLQPGDLVRMAGVDVGRVEDVELDGPKVLVSFGLRDVQLTDTSKAAIKTETLLGSRFLQVLPEHGTPVASGATIPLARTTAPFNVTTGVENVTRRLGEINTGQLGSALDTTASSLADLRQGDITGALDGLTRLSQTINTRDRGLLSLLNNANGVTAILRDRSGQLTTLMTDGNLLLGELQRRREVIHRLLGDALRALDQVHGLIRDNQRQLGPVLDRLNYLIDILRHDEGSLVRSIQGLGSFAQGVGEAIGSGPYFEAKVENLAAGAFVPLAPYLGPAASAGPPLGPNPRGAPSPASIPLLGDSKAPFTAPRAPAHTAAPALPGVLDTSGGNR